MTPLEAICSGVALLGTIMLLFLIFGGGNKHREAPIEPKPGPQWSNETYYFPEQDLRPGGSSNRHKDDPGRGEVMRGYSKTMHDLNGSAGRGQNHSARQLGDGRRK